MTAILAVPSEAPGGPNAEISAHFGHCDAFSLFAVDGGRIVGHSVLQTAPHEHGNCLAPVRLLADQGVSVLIARGMGARPLNGFVMAGIRPFFAGRHNRVSDAVLAYMAGQLPGFVPENACAHHADDSDGCHA